MPGRSNPVALRTVHYGRAGLPLACGAALRQVRLDLRRFADAGGDARAARASCLRGPGQRCQACGPASGIRTTIMPSSVPNEASGATLRTRRRIRTLSGCMSRSRPPCPSRRAGAGWRGPGGCPRLGPARRHRPRRRIPTRRCPSAPPTRARTPCRSCQGGRYPARPGRPAPITKSPAAPSYAPVLLAFLLLVLGAVAAAQAVPRATRVRLVVVATARRSATRRAPTTACHASGRRTT
jgi:hypothetical protein